jgi:hypothetical protein
MSALFEQDTSITTKHVSLERTLELRQTPHLRQGTLEYPPDPEEQPEDYPLSYTGNTNVAGAILGDLFMGPSTNWLYSGVIQATSNTTDPSWSKDGWSFAPIDLSPARRTVDQLRNTFTDENRNSTYLYMTNITMETVGTRGRAQCDPASDVHNQSSWINSTLFLNPQTNQTFEAYYLTPITFNTTNQYTTLTPSGDMIACCSNESYAKSSDTFAPVVFGYWAPIYGSHLFEPSSSIWPYGNFSVKWIYGQGRFVPPFGSVDQFYPGGLVWSEIPQIQAFDCMPIIETSEAEVTVDITNGNILAYHLLDQPKPDESAWSDAFIVRNLTEPLKTYSYDPELNNKSQISQNITVRYRCILCVSPYSNC